MVVLDQDEFTTLKATIWNICQSETEIVLVWQSKRPLALGSACMSLDNQARTLDPKCQICLGHRSCGKGRFKAIPTGYISGGSCLFDKGHKSYKEVCKASKRACANSVLEATFWKIAKPYVFEETRHSERYSDTQKYRVSSLTLHPKLLSVL